MIAARLSADVLGVPTLIFARTDAEAADLLTSDVDDNDKPFCTGERTVEGFYRTKSGFDQAVSGLAYAPYADLIWCETGKPDLEFAKNFAEAIHNFLESYFHTIVLHPLIGRSISMTQLSQSSKGTRAMGYKFQFITLAGFHSLNYSMFNLAHGYAKIK